MRSVEIDQKYESLNVELNVHFHRLWQGLYNVSASTQEDLSLRLFMPQVPVYHLYSGTDPWTTRFCIVYTSRSASSPPDLRFQPIEKTRLWEVNFHSFLLPQDIHLTFRSFWNFRLPHWPKYFPSFLFG